MKREMSNITVAVRVRPLITKELQENLPVLWKIDGVTMHSIDPVTQKPGNETYRVDQIYPEEMSTRDIYLNLAKPIIDAVVNGYNGTICAYGQTSSGKTYTMIGDNNSKGIIQLAIANIFELIEKVRDRKYLLRCQYVELYNDKIFDLLNDNKEVKIREYESGEPKTDAKEVVVNSASMLLELMEEGSKARKVGETKANEKSSRSHAVFRIVMESTKFVNYDIIAQVGQLNLVDLAGSERASVTQATGARLKEGAQINKSLSTLGLVIKQLTEGQEHVHFRDSKLTRLLEPSLGGNALTAIICAVTPAALEETHSTLAFACRAKDIKNKPIINVVGNSESSLLNKLTIEIKNLNEKLQQASITSQEQDLLNKDLAEKVSYLEKRLIYRSRLLEKKKKDSRRRTTCGEDGLPIINEGTAWESSNVSDQQSPEDQPGPSNAPQDQGAEESDSNSAQDSQDEDVDYASEDNSDSLAEDSQKFLKWLVDDSVRTPRSVLKQRAAYFEEEYKSLQELTSTEQRLMTERLEMSLSELKQTVQSLEIEREKSQNECVVFKQQIQNLESEIASQNTFVLELQELRKSQSATYINELCDQKNILNSLREQLMVFATSSVPEAVGQVNDVVKIFEAKIDELDNIVSDLNGEKDLPQDFQPAILVLKSICEECTEVEEMIDELPADAVGFFRIFKLLCDLVTELLILVLMKYDKHFSSELTITRKKADRKIFKLKAMISIKDSEIEQLSDKIMKYLSQLEDAELQVEQIKKIAASLRNECKTKDTRVAYYFSKIETLNEKCLNISKVTDLKIKLLKEEADLWKSKYKAAEKEMEDYETFEEKDEQITDLKNKFRLLQSQCEHSLRKFNFVDTDNPLTVDEIIEGLNAQENHIVHLQGIVGDLKKKMEEKRMPSSYVEHAERNRDQARDAEIETLSEALRYQSVQLDEYRKILAPSDKPETRSVVYYLEKQSVDLNELKRANDVLQKDNRSLRNDSETKNELIEQLTNQIQQLQSQALELVNNAQNTGPKQNKQESTTTKLQVALEQQALPSQFEIDLERKEVLLKQIKAYFSSITEKDELNDIFELKEHDSIKEKQEIVESMLNEFKSRNNKVDELEILFKQKESTIMNIMLERDEVIRNNQELKLENNDLKVNLENTRTETMGLRCALQTQRSITSTIQSFTMEITEKNQATEDLAKVMEEKHHLECLTQEQEIKLTKLEEELDKMEADNRKLSKKVKLLSHDLAVRNDAIYSQQNLMEKKDQDFEFQKDTVFALQDSLSTKKENIQRLEQEVQTLKKDLCSKDNTIKFVESIVKQKDEEIISKRNKIRELHKSLNAKNIPSELTTKKEYTEDLEEEEDEAPPEVESLKIRCKELCEARIQALHAKDSLMMRCDELSVKIKNLSANVTERDQTIQFVENIVKQKEEVIISKRNKIYELQESLNAKNFSSELTKKKEYTEDLEEEEDETPPEMEILKIRCDELCEARNEALRAKDSLVSRCDELSNKIKHLTVQLSEKVEVPCSDKSLAIRYNELSDKLKRLTTEFAEKDEELREQGEELRGKASLATHCDELGSKIKRLTLELDEKEEALREKESLSMYCDELTEKIRILSLDVVDEGAPGKKGEHANDFLAIRCDELSDEVKRLNVELFIKEQLHEEKNEVIREKESLLIGIEELTEKNHILNVELLDKELEIQSVEAIMHDNEAKLKFERKVNQNLRETISEFNEKVNNLLMELKLKEEKSQNLQFLLDEKEEHLKNSRAEHLLEISSKEKSIESIKSLTEEKDNMLKSQQDTVLGLQESLTKHTDVMQQREFQTHLLNQKIADLELDISKMNHHEVILNEQEEEIKRLKDSIKTFHGLVEQKNAALEHHEVLIKQLHETNDKSKQMIDDKDSQINDLTTLKVSFNKLQTRMNVMLNQHNSTKGICKAREDENVGLKAKVLKLGQAHKSLEEQSQTWKAKYNLAKKETENLVKITTTVTEEQKIKDAQTDQKMSLMFDELQLQKNKYQSISEELQDARECNKTLSDDNKCTKGALENAVETHRRLRLERLKVETEKLELDENLKAAKLEITRRIRERDNLKRELKNTQFDASRNLQDAQTETEDVPQATGEPSSAKGGASPDEEEPRQIASLQEKVTILTRKIDTLQIKYRSVKKVCLMRKQQIDALTKK